MQTPDSPRSLAPVSRDRTQDQFFVMILMGKVVGLRLLHNRIQIDPPKQRTVYNRAMDLWR